MKHWLRLRISLLFAPNAKALFSAREGSALCLGLLIAHTSALQAQPELVVTQSPHTAAGSDAATGCRGEYAPGTRVAVINPEFAVDHVRVLSQGLYAAGSPKIDYQGRRVLFCGKASAGSDWQIYECNKAVGRPRALTAMPGGAMAATLLPDESIVFVSPAPARSGVSSGKPQLFVQSRGSKPRQLTFAAGGAWDPVVLQDGRILFVSAQPTSRSEVAGSALYTINNDGTEITAFACQHDVRTFLLQPRELRDKRVVFLAMPNESATEMKAEYVRMARPFAGRSALLANCSAPVHSVEPAGAGQLLVCALTSKQGSDASPIWACFRIESDAKELGAPLVCDRSWDTIEAIEAAAGPKPMGRISTMDPSKRTGQILCLNINDTTIRPPGQEIDRAKFVRIVAQTSDRAGAVLGELPVQEDGSFMAEVPADTLLGFEALDEQGRVVRREAPTIWVRAGENRACIGCHATHNRAPQNHRPLAVRLPVPSLRLPGASTLAHQSR